MGRDRHPSFQKVRNGPHRNASRCLGPQVAHDRHRYQIAGQRTPRTVLPKGKISLDFFKAKNFPAASRQDLVIRKFAAASRRGFVVPEKFSAASRRGFVGGGRQAIGVVSQDCNAVVCLVSFSEGRVWRTCGKPATFSARLTQGQCKDRTSRCFYC